MRLPLRLGDAQTPALRSLPLLALAVACSTGPAPEEDATTGRSSSAVINGTLDTTHDAVIAMGSASSLCTGTIVEVDPQRRIGWVLTAAHCVESPPKIVLQGRDFLAASTLKYDVVDYAADPRYASDKRYDFAVVRIAGVDATTPTIPITSSPDNVTMGLPVTSVGFGRTVGGENVPNDNSRRWAVQKTLDEVSSTLIGYDMSTKGICQGDSGGPVLAGSGSNERVIGVHSFVSGVVPYDCDGRGYSSRLSAGLSFVNQELTKALPDESCGLCGKIADSGKNECAAMTAACLADPDCRGYIGCLREGKKSERDCVLDYPLAEGPFKAAASCVCQRACKDVCAFDVSCKSVPRCGYQLDAGACTSCVESSCCDEELECAADGQCYVCLKGDDADPECATNPQRKKLASCAATKCKDECADSSVGAGAEPPPPEEEEGEAEPPAAAASPTTTTITKTGCAATPSAAPGAGGSGLALAALALARLRRRARGGARSSR